ncbi:hypothetical protein QCA50_006081 [Cerrena zonata]|uniref:DUF4604 domain-containing protein n=1 Tax=Cerrena zonata TaxID=2478898 RepID=A0AAW0GL83_9APHY
MSKEPTRAQLSSKLAYHSKTPAFLQKFQKKVNGGGQDSDEDDEWEYDGSGRPPIPKRPAIPERPSGDAGSADEDDLDEGPQIVVLKEGKHLSERDVENEKRRAKGLPPLTETDFKEKDIASTSKSAKAPSEPVSKIQSTGLSFSSSSTAAKGSKKRKAVGDGKDDDEKPKSSKSGKKPKKAQKKLLSFDDEA